MWFEIRIMFMGSVHRNIEADTSNKKECDDRNYQIGRAHV